MAVVGLADVQAAQAVLKGLIHHTPLDISTTFSRMAQCQVYLKAENLQKTGSFKIRGAINKMHHLPPGTPGVIAASAGNHAQGVAFAASRLGIPATVVMPVGAPVSKVTATAGYGAKVVQAGDSYDGAYQRALEIRGETGETFIHAFDDPQVVAGQGTIGLEILADLPDVEAVVAPIGGGGLIAGIGLVMKSLRPEVRVIGVQAEGAPSMQVSRQEGAIRQLDTASTIADGIAVKKPGSLTFDLVQRLVDDIVLVPDEDTATAMLALLERSKLLVEGAGAIALAALLSGRISLPGRRVVVVLSGGNVDVHVIAQIIERGLAKTGRFVTLRTVVVDRPGALNRLLTLVASTQANIISITHDRIKPTVPIRQAEVELALETRDWEHIREITTLLSGHGYQVERV